MKRALPLALILAGCSGPAGTQLQSDFVSLHPGCRLLSSGAGEGDDENVYVVFKYKCGTSPQTVQSEALYQRHKGKWVLNRQVSRSLAGKPAGT